jgi:predicted amidophosphoribosyltransferase
VSESSKVEGTDYLIIDDVVTTGASLMYARKKLKQSGARNVTLLALAKTVTDLN